MRIRRPDEPSDDEPYDHERSDHERSDRNEFSDDAEPTQREPMRDGPAPGIGYGPDGSIFFRVRTGVIAGKFAVAALLVIIALATGRGFSLWLGVVAAALVAAYGLRDVLGRERLRADARGVRIGTGFAGHRDLPWSQLERVRVDQRLRLGLRADLLEFDAGEELFLLSRYDLGADPHDAYEALSQLRGGHGHM